MGAIATRELKVNIVGDSRDLERALGRASKASSGLGSAFRTLGKAAALVGVAMGAAAVAGIGKSVEAASNLTEQINKANVVFRGSEKEVLSWSKGLTQSFGLSQRAALEAAGTFGNMLVPMGYARDEAARMSEQMVELAGDMASFNNASPEDTLLAIRSGLAGEAEPLRKYGVFLSEARVQQEALTATGKKSVKELTNQEKATARYNLILKDTKDTQGDFARSAGSSLANQLRITRAEFENLAASLGEALLPVIIKVLGFVNSRLIPGLGNAADFVKDFWKGMQASFSRAPDFRAKVRVVFEGVETLATQFVDALISKIGSLLPQKEVPLNFKLQHRGGETMGGGVDWDAVASDIVAALSAALAASSDLAKSLGDTISTSFQQVDWVGVGRKAGPGLLTAVAVAFSTALDPAFWIRNWDLALAIGVVAFGGAIGKVVSRLVGFLAPALVRVVEGASPKFAAAMGRLIDDAGRVMIAALGKLGPFLQGKVAALFLKIGSVATFTIKVLGVLAAINVVTQFANKVTGKLKTLATDAYTWAWAIGAQIVSGILSGMVDLAVRIGTWIASKVKAGIDWAKKNIGSTAEEYASTQLGEPLAAGTLAGYALGIKAMPERIANSIREAVVAVRGEIDNAAKVIGVGQAQGIVRGFLEQQPSAKQQITQALRQAVQEAIQKAADAVRDARSAFASAFSELASQALSAFDAAMSTWKPKAQKILDAREYKKQTQDAAQAVTDASQQMANANAEMAKALAGGDPQQIQQARDAQIAAQKAYNDALYNQETLNLQRQAALEQEAHDKRAAREKLALEKRYAALEAAYNKELAALVKKHNAGDLTDKQFHDRRIALQNEYSAKERAALNESMKKLGVDQKFWGTAAGISLAAGLNSAIAKVAQAATRLARVLERLLKLKTKSSWDTEEGPMADFGHWWDNLAEGLVAGIDYQKIAAAGKGVAATFKGGVDSGVAGWGAGIDWVSVVFPGGVPEGLGQEIMDSIAGVNTNTTAPAIDALGGVSESLATTTASTEAFAAAVEALPSRAQAAFNRLVELIMKAVTPLPALLAPTALAFLAIADSILALGSAAYQARAALRDTAAEIARLLREIAAAGAAYGTKPAGMASGGTVTVGTPYIVGEAGPELFIPSTSGRIAPSVSGGTPLGGTVVNVAVYGDVTGDEIVRKVREGLLRINLLNPGNPVARPA